MVIASFQGLKELGVWGKEGFFKNTEITHNIL